MDCFASFKRSHFSISKKRLLEFGGNHVGTEKILTDAVLHRRGRMSFEETALYIEGLNELTRSIKKLCEQEKNGSPSEVVENLLKALEDKQTFGVRNTIEHLKSFLSHQACHLGKEELKDVVDKFTQALAAFMVSWSSFFEECTTRSYHLLLLQEHVIGNVAEVLLHCKESTSVYESCFLEVSTFLSNLFKSTYQALKVILNSLENFGLNENNQREVSQYAKCMMQLFEVSLILKDIDLLPLGNTLRCLNRIILSKSCLLHGELDGSQIFKVICSCLVDKLNFSWSLIEEAISQNQVDSKRLSKVSKILRFLLGMLLQLIKIYRKEIYGITTKWLIDVLLQLQWMSPKTIHAKLINNACYQVFCSSVLIAIEPLLLELIDERDFIASFLTSEGFLNDDVNTKDLLSALILIAEIASHLAKTKDETKDEWMKEDTISSRRTIVDVALQLYERCVEKNLESVMLPLRVEADKPPRNTTLHEYICVGLCALTVTFKQSNYAKLETCLLRHLMISKFSNLLASDILSFIARWGPEALCWQLTDFFANLNSFCNNHGVQLVEGQEYFKNLVEAQSLVLFKSASLSSETLRRSLSMMQRLFLLLGDSKKELFINNYLTLSCEGMPLFMGISGTGMNDKCFGKFIDRVIGLSLQGLEDFKANGQLKMMLMTLKVWENCLARNNALQFLTSLQRNALTNAIMEVILSFKGSKFVEIDEQFVCILIGATCNILCDMEQRQIKEVLQVMDELLKCNQSEVLSFQICRLLKTMKSIQFEREHKDCSLRSISRIFKGLLLHQSFVVRHEAMKSLKAFAELTMHSEVIPECLPESLNDRFKDFIYNVKLLRRMPPHLQEERCKNALMFIAENEYAKDEMIEEENDPPKSPVFEVNHEELRVMETNLRNAADAIREYAHAKPIPERMLVIIKNIAEGILQLGTTC